jgi:hypothetical protein
MVTISIGTSGERNLNEADERWINQQINRRRDNDEPVCVRVRIKDGYLDLLLATPSCGGGSGGRAPNVQEQQIINLWDKHGLFNSNFNGGNLVAFLKQLDRFI